MPRDLLHTALRNDYLTTLAFKNPDVSQTFVGIVDRIWTFYGDEVSKLEIKGPLMGCDGFDCRFTLGGK